MGLSRVRELVSQAEKEGVSLGILIAREMTAKEMDLAQSQLCGELEANYSSISNFMAKIEIPSIEDILSRAEPRGVDSIDESSDSMIAEVE